MTGRAEPAGGGFSVLDGAALVAGAAVASVHIRGVLRGEPAGPGGVLLLGTFAWVSLTAAGPFLYLVRRYARDQPGYPKVGDRLWGVLGLPWLLTAGFQAVPAAASPSSHVLLATGLSIGLAVVSLVCLSVVWMTWVVATPERASETFSAPWTNRVGLFLAIAWPVQCAAGMVVIG
jgi:hypothetical protein